MPRYTKTGKKTALADVEDKLKKEYPGSATSRTQASKVYGTLNEIGLLHGNKPTKKGLRPAKKKRR